MVRVRYSFGSRHTGRIANIAKQRKPFPKVMKEVLEISDIVLEVLDARFIEETRNLEVEEMVDSLGKRLVYVFNKSDLVDAEELESQIPDWMRPYVFVSATKRRGLNELKARIRMEAKRVLKEWRDAGIKRDRVQVGVVGVPNAGKSSVINFVTRRNAAGTGAKAGFTKGMQKIRLGEGILILDTPGVIQEERYTTEVGNKFFEDVKIGARSYSDIKDPVGALQYLLEGDKGRIEKFYGVSGEGVDLFVEALGNKRGFLLKGGVVDEDRTARLVLRDWQEGKIK
jgi:ribosome biogenesis GTPase A